MKMTKGNHDSDICALMHARHKVVTRRTNVRTLRSVPARVVYNAFAPNQRTQPVTTYFLRILAVCAAALFAAAASAQEDFSKVEIQTEKLADTVYMMTGSGGNLGLSVGEDAVFVIDDQFAPLTPKILAAIAKLSPKPVKFVLNTHWHFDHTGGNENLGKAGAVIVAHENVRKRLSAEGFLESFGMNVPASPKPALPVLTFAGPVPFHLNREEVRAS